LRGDKRRKENIYAGFCYKYDKKEFTERFEVLTSQIQNLKGECERVLSGSLFLSTKNQ